MSNKLAYTLNHKLERHLPEQRLFLRSDEGTRFITLSPLTQLVGWIGSAAFVAWAIIATAVLLMDSIGSGTTLHAVYADRVVLNENGALTNLRLPVDSPSWSGTDFHPIDERFLWHVNPNADQIVFLARLSGLETGPAPPLADPARPLRAAGRSPPATARRRHR